MKRNKLTKVQAAIVEAIDKANYYYSIEGENVDVMDGLYIDGKEMKNETIFLTEEGKYRVELNTKTLNGLVEKGYLEQPEELRGTGYELVEVKFETSKPKLYKELTRVVLTKTEWFAFTKKYVEKKKEIFFPAEQRDITLQNFDLNEWEIKSESTVKVKTMK